MDATNPFETPIPRGVRTVQGTLRVVVAVQCWGMAAAWLHQGQSAGVAEYLQTVYQIPAASAAQVETYSAYALIACGFLTLVRPCWPVLLPVAAWQMAVATAAVVQGQGTISALAPAEQAVRFMAPIALLLIDFWPPKLRSTLNFCRTAVGLLRVAAATTFAAHGLVYLHQFSLGGDLQGGDPQGGMPQVGNVADLMTLSFSRTLQFNIEPDVVQQTLAVIGAVDIAAAFVLLTSRSRSCAAWMAFWGLLTACSHFLAYGIDGYHETLIRVADGGAPLAILLFWLWAVRERPPEFVPGEE